jgi:hypothetical protein
VNLAHLHLVINHVPTIGSVAALGILLLGYVRRNDHLKHVGLEVLFIVALLTLPVYVSGAAGYFEIRERPGVSVDTMRLHQDVALFGFIWMMMTGFVGWTALWTWRRHGRPGRGLVPAATLRLVMSLIVMGRAANLGGEIRHPEILAAGAQSAPAPAGDPNRFFTSAVNKVAVYSTWAWPAAETVHFLGLSLSLGVLLAINLRLLGFLSAFSFADVHRLLPWGMLGFGANLITGMFFFVGQPAQYTASVPFYWKTLFLVIAGANFLYLTVFGKPWHREGGGAASRFEPNMADKAMAILSLASWLGVLYAGRMLPFLGRSF